MKTICILLTTQPWNEMRLFYRQAPALANQGYKVKFVCPNPPPIELRKGIEFVSLSRVGKKLSQITGALNLLFFILNLKADVIQITCMEQLPLGIVLSKFARKKIVYDCREDHVNSLLSHKDNIPKVFRYLVAFIIRFFELIAGKSFSGLIASDPAIYKMHKNIPSEKKIIYYNAPLLSMFKSEFPNLKDREYDICFLGSASVRVGVDTLLEAIGMLKQRHNIRLKLLMIGHEPDGNLKAVMDKLIVKYDLEGQITNTGYVDHQRIPKLLWNSKIGVSPHKNYEKFRNNIACKCFEYMAAGMPVVCSDLPPQHIFIREGVNGFFFPPSDPAALMRVFLELTSDISFAQTIGFQGRKDIEEAWNCERENRKLTRFYSTLI